MTNYITTLKSMKQLPGISKEDAIFIVAKADESLKVEELNEILGINNIISGKLTLLTYSLKEELSLAIGTPIIQNPEDEFILVDSSFPAFQMFGDRVKKISTKKSTTRKKPSTSKKVSKDPVIKHEPVDLRVSSKAIKVTSDMVKPTVTLAEDKSEKEKTSNKVLKESSKPIKDVSEKKEEDLEKKRIELAAKLKKVVDLDPSDYDFLMSKDIFYLMIAQIFERSVSDDEIKRTLESQPKGEDLVIKLEPHFEEIKAFMGSQ